MQGRAGRVPRGWTGPSVTKALPSLDIGQIDNIPRTLLRKKKKKKGEDRLKSVLLRIYIYFSKCCVRFIQKTMRFSCLSGQAVSTDSSLLCEEGRGERHDSDQGPAAQDPRPAVLVCSLSPTDPCQVLQQSGHQRVRPGLLVSVRPHD